MGQPVATKKSGGICFAFPDVCLTTIVVPVPIPYPNIGLLGDATKTSEKVTIGGEPVILESSEIPTTMGDEAGSIGGVMSGKIKGKVTFASYSSKVMVEGKAVVRVGDTTQQNDNNSIGTVILSGNFIVSAG